MAKVKRERVSKCVCTYVCVCARARAVYRIVAQPEVEEWQWPRHRPPLQRPLASKSKAAALPRVVHFSASPSQHLIG